MDAGSCSDGLQHVDADDHDETVGCLPIPVPGNNGFDDAADYRTEKKHVALPSIGSLYPPPVILPPPARKLPTHSAGLDFSELSLAEVTKKGGP